MEAMIKHVALYPLWGAPVWAWLAVSAIAGAQEWISRSPKLKANTYVQAIGDLATRARGTVLGKFPVLAQALAVLGAMKTPAPPPAAAPEKVQQ